MNEIDWGVVIPVLLGLAGALAAYLRASGKWIELKTALAKRREARQDDREEKLQARVDELVDERMAEQRVRVEKLESINAQHHEDIDHLSATVHTLIQENAQCRNSIDVLEEARLEEQRRHESARMQWRATQDSLERDLENLRGQVTTMSDDLSRKTTELEGLRVEMREMNASMRDLEIANARLEEENKGLRATNTMLVGLVERWDKVLPEFSRVLATLNVQPGNAS